MVAADAIYLLDTALARNCALLNIKLSLELRNTSDQMLEVMFKTILSSIKYMIHSIL